MSTPITRTTRPTCASCGAVDLGTNFCETCGASLLKQHPTETSAAATPTPPPSAPLPPEGVTAPHPVPTASPGPDTVTDPALGLRATALVIYLLGLIVTGSIYVAQATTATVPASAPQWSDTVSALLVALFMLIAAVGGRASDGGKALGILGALGYAIATPIIDFNTSSLDPGLYTWLPVIPAFFLFVAWAGGRSFKAGWAAAIAVVAIAYFSGKVAPVLGSGAANYQILVGGYFALGLTVVVLIANGFDGPKPGARRANPLARTALILLLLSFMLNSTAGSLLGTGGSVAALVFVILFVVLAIILGHVGFVQAGKRGEGGRGLALTALIIGYLLVVFYIVILVMFASFLGALSGAIT